MSGFLKSISAFVQAKPLTTVGIVAAFSILATAGTVWYVLQRPILNSVAVTKSALTEVVTATGSVNAAQAADLSLEVSGRVTALPVSVGTHVGQGALLLATDAGMSAASVDQARAALDAQKAKLAALAAGTRPEQLAINQTAVSGAETSLTQANQSVINAVRSAYVTSDDAIHSKTDQFFTNARQENAKLTFNLPNLALQNTIQNDRVAIEAVLSAWQVEVSAPDFRTTSDTAAIAADAETKLTTIAAFLDEINTALTTVQSSSSLPLATLSGYQASVSAARLAVSGALSAVTSAQTGETGAKTALASAKANLTLAQAGATQNDIDAQNAQVAAAAAALESAQAALGKTAIYAPFAGTITRNDANVGQFLSPNTPVISIISDAAFQVEAQVSETEVGKIAVGNPVLVTLDAYPSDAPVAATVSAVDLAPTMQQGVAAYKVTAVFTKNDPKIKTGLTGNLTITTKQIGSAVQVPTSAIIQNGTNYFVMKVTSAGAVKTPVTVGASSATSGTTEILSGLSVGDRVAAYGNVTH